MTYIQEYHFFLEQIFILLRKSLTLFKIVGVFFFILLTIMELLDQGTFTSSILLDVAKLLFMSLHKSEKLS